jgi:FMN phosphatase YigB (HAD superfamily)
MIGDTLSADILGANQLGMFSIWINRWADTVENRSLREKIQPNATILQLSEILVSLKKVKKQAGE